ncbi:MAG: hypothetical protein LBH79_06665 [Nitrososphaerota archaeon]|jgi:hypothetical protein|nr:hypothetical protein [Nitrososphaerota archaeon]
MTEERGYLELFAVVVGFNEKNSIATARHTNRVLDSVRSLESFLNFQRDPYSVRAYPYGAAVTHTRVKRLVGR